MAGASDGELARIGGAIAAQTRALHLGQHLGARWWQAVSPLGSARTGPRRALAAAVAVVDVATSRWITVPRRHLGVQAAIDLVDQALWSALAADEPESSRCAMIPGTSLASELGARWQWRAVALPAAHVAVAAAVRSRRGHRLRVGQVGWQLWGVFGTIALARLGRWRRGRARRRHLDALAPALVAAEIEGMHDVGVLADHLLDTAQRATILVELSLGARGEFTGALDPGAIKQEMAALTRHVGAYLGDVVVAWQRVRNAAPDLRRAVRFDVDPDAATRVLDAAQVDAVRAFLDEVAPVGNVAVRVDGDELVVGDRRLALGRVVDVPSLFFDPMPIALLMDAAWIAATTGRARDHVRWSHAGPPVAVALAQAWRSARVMRAPDRDRVDRTSSVAASGLALGLLAAFGARGARSPMTPTGVRRYPFTQALQGYVAVLRIAERDLAPRTRRSAWAWAAAAVAIGVARTPRPRSTRHLLAELVWPLTTASFAAAITGSIATDSEAIRGELRAEEERLLREARQRGADRMLRLVRTSVQAASDSLVARRDELAPDVAREAEHRISRARAQLAGLERG